MISPYKLASVLLRYPDAELARARPEIHAAVAALPEGPQRAGLERFCAEWGAADAAHYVEVFDLKRRASLHLTFFTHGDTRKRGMALLRLKKLYRAAGWPWESRELPDYLPGMLEFAAVAEDGRGEALLAEHRAELELLRRALHDLGSPYAHVVDAVVAELPGLDPSGWDEVRRLMREGPPTEEVGLETLQPFAPGDVMPDLEVRR